ncbi:TetR/AcrR family transcriptional regulator [Saccharopolyspora phatthalungensis]|uniref:AcrR family transcriptional regulator n=1 Tax=Saccharopolyspora phatthalungensis TaxID=664693 RepID=A0A840QA10_9PSEU|nr:TetR/AcrR family transcriptional regulator [Saccharopolyspora phatthalungensis]MBB5155399.1 AcrR family transcriptional regulator [Saccharopolyspora phatthalungensis]
MPGSRKAKAAETEAALKAAARRVFDRIGYLNTKITDITAEAGRAAGSFYNHFASKEELLESLLADMLAAGDRIVETDSTHDPDFTNREAIRWHIAQYWRFFRANQSVVIALQQAALVDQRFADRLSTLLEPDLRDLADHIRQAGVAEPAAVALAVSSMWHRFAYALLVDRNPLVEGITDDEAIELLTDLTHRGLSGK